MNLLSILAEKGLIEAADIAAIEEEVRKGGLSVEAVLDKKGV